MEVHHHPNIERKNFKEYFLEFIMIFLAVTLGFFAESLREHLSNKQLQTADSLQAILPRMNSETPANTVYTSLRKMIRQQGIRIFVTDRTIEQIKNAGEMRLLSNKEISDSLVDYYKEVDFIQYLQRDLLDYKAELKADFPGILKSQDYNKVIDAQDNINNPNENLYLSATDSFTINKILLEVSDIKGLSHSIQSMIAELSGKAENIKKLITNNYNIQN